MTLRRILSVASALFMLVFGVAPAFAEEPDWELAGVTLEVDFSCTSGCTDTWHQSWLIQSMNPATGAFTARGTDPAVSATWNFSGTLSASNLSYTGITTLGSGTIADDGMLSGTGTGSGFAFSFQSKSLIAKSAAFFSQLGEQKTGACSGGDDHHCALMFTATGQNTDGSLLTQQPDGSITVNRDGLITVSATFTARLRTSNPQLRMYMWINQQPLVATIQASGAGGRFTSVNGIYFWNAKAGDRITISAFPGDYTEILDGGWTTLNIRWVAP